MINTELDNLLYKYRQLARAETKRKVLNGEYQEIETAINQLLLKARRDENQWWIDYLNQGLKGKDPESGAAQVFQHRIKYHRERIAELDNQIKGES